MDFNHAGYPTNLPFPDNQIRLISPRIPPLPLPSHTRQATVYAAAFHQDPSTVYHYQAMTLPVWIAYRGSRFSLVAALNEEYDILRQEVAELCILPTGTPLPVLRVWAGGRRFGWNNDGVVGYVDQLSEVNVLALLRWLQLRGGLDWIEVVEVHQA